MFHNWFRKKKTVEAPKPEYELYYVEELIKRYSVKLYAAGAVYEFTLSDMVVADHLGPEMPGAQKIISVENQLGEFNRIYVPYDYSFGKPPSYTLHLGYTRTIHWSGPYSYELTLIDQKPVSICKWRTK